ncbi:peptidoglycan DD-metalloendopeptidase family protein [Thalassobellus suaedae]|uniref:Peptidoglycan DD-metalloendopeptidase family protein n=1 Tax=Thalassobellus suaedae TaxID=3074124 RepID=A0ABY9Y052_9FLAO|nr:peptidoglycan DD-metalloendopeptidase family protein [Flavobacteriaceae bacterium HL-DH10]
MFFKNFSEFLFDLYEEPIRVIDSTIENSKYIEIDLSIHNKVLNKLDVSSASTLGDYITNHIKKHNAHVAFGGYNETRNIYKRNTHFNDESSTERNIHLGVDLWCDVNTPVFAPLDATVHSFKNNANYGDYGPTIILKHDIKNVEFYTLYGHLSLSSITGLKVGEKIKQGEQIAVLGGAIVNGNYPPHLHFQIIKDIQGFKGDYSGVCSLQNLKFYLSNCPNPNVILKLGF